MHICILEDFCWVYNGGRDFGYKLGAESPVYHLLPIVQKAEAYSLLEFCMTRGRYVT